MDDLTEDFKDWLAKRMVSQRMWGEYPQRYKELLVAQYGNEAKDEQGGTDEKAVRNHTRKMGKAQIPIW